MLVDEACLEICGADVGEIEFIAILAYAIYSYLVSRYSSAVLAEGFDNTRNEIGEDHRRAIYRHCYRGEGYEF